MSAEGGDGALLQKPSASDHLPSSPPNERRSDGDIAMDVRKTDFGADDRPLSILNNGSSPTVDSFLSIRNDRHNGCVLVHR